MKIKILIIFIAILSPYITLGQKPTKYKKHYIPKNINECLTQLDNIISDSTKQKILQYSENEFIGLFHFSLGMYIRDKWGLWRGSDLSAYFNKLGVYHPDDMSGIIMRSYYRYLKGMPINFIQQINKSREYIGLPAIKTNNEDSLMNFTVKFNPFYKPTHSISTGEGRYIINAEKFNQLLTDNNIPPISFSPVLLTSGYMFIHKNIIFSLNLSLISINNEQNKNYKISYSFYDPRIGGGYFFLNSYPVAVIGFIEYGFAWFNYSASSENTFSFENQTGINEIKLNQFIHHISPGTGIYLTPGYEFYLGIRLNYDFTIKAGTDYDKILLPQHKNTIIGTEGVEILFSAFARI